MFLFRICSFVVVEESFSNLETPWPSEPFVVFTYDWHQRGTKPPSPTIPIGTQHALFMTYTDLTLIVACSILLEVSGGKEDLKMIDVSNVVV